MGYTAQYDALDTLRWMVNDARDAVLADTYVDGKGKAKAKSKARREAERIRYETLCEVMWNVAGRPESLEAVTRDGILLA
ncbi:MAG: hypothetical protein AB1416_11515 [Actinomycetota bacterium]